MSKNRQAVGAVGRHVSNLEPYTCRGRPMCRPLDHVSEVEANADPHDSRVHDLEHLVEPGGARQTHVVLPAEHRARVEQVEDIEVDVERRASELDVLSDPEIERLRVGRR